jgi:hypothetical protein
VTEPSPAAIDVALHRRRLMWMVAVDAVCFLVALGAIIGNVYFHIAWLLWLFLAAMLAGFGAQGWLIMGLTRKP